MSLQHRVVLIGGVTGARDLLAGIGGALCHLRKNHHFGGLLILRKNGLGLAVLISGLHDAV